MKKIQDILNNNLCCGCGSCTNIFDGINMDYNENGDLRPYINYNDESNEKLEKYNKICPGIITYSECNNGNQVDDIWGSYKTITTGYAKNTYIRHIGSSGGSITSILAYLIEQKFIDGVIHIGTSDVNPILNVVKVSKNIKEIVNNSGSRYSPSSPLENITEILKLGDKFAFVGKPCDVVAMRNYMENDDLIKEKVKYLISFFCAGVPSIKGTKKILEINNVEENDVKEFRYRGDGWPGYTKIKTKLDKEYKMTYEEAWGRILNKYLPKRCKICPDGIGESADIVCGDAWYGDQNGYPTFEESDGRSLIISRTNLGEELLNKAIKEGYLCTEGSIGFEELKSIQPFQFYRKTTLIYRLLAMKILFKDTPRYKKIKLIRASKQNNVKEHLKSFSGTFIRLIKKKL